MNPKLTNNYLITKYLFLLELQIFWVLDILFANIFKSEQKILSIKTYQNQYMFLKTVKELSKKLFKLCELRGSCAKNLYVMTMLIDNCFETKIQIKNLFQIQKLILKLMFKWETGEYGNKSLSINTWIFFISTWSNLNS